ncbi:MAG: alpha-galactosidase [Bacteroidota bacterium]
MSANHKIYQKLFLLFALLLTIQSHAQVKEEKNSILLHNNVIKKEISINKTNPSPIHITSIFNTEQNRELIYKSQETSWFEFVIDDQLVKSSDPLWQFQNVKKRQLRNGGTEYQLMFKGEKEPVAGLAVHIYQQFFPNSTLIREKLKLKTNNEAFELNKLDGNLHFIFPKYNFAKKNNQINSTEINIARWNDEVLDKINCSAEDRRHGDNNLSQAHMYHPEVTEKSLIMGSSASLKGPFGLLSNDEFTVMTAYEHASQDNLIEGDMITRIREKMLGSSELKENEKELQALINEKARFLSVFQKSGRNSMQQGVNIERGGYIDGEKIAPDKPYASVWTATGHFFNEQDNQPKTLLHNYMLKWITEWPHTREQEFYYNTWGMQRNVPGDQTRSVLTYDRIFQEIRNAAELGAEIFVLDDGWEKEHGIWKPHPERLNKGLKPIYDTLQKYNMKMGAWINPIGIAKNTERYKEHPEWIIRHQDGTPVSSQWGHPVFDFVSGYSDLFIEDCKRLIDQGVRFFKWDAVNTFYPNKPGLHHGDKDAGKEEIIARYGYLLPVYIKKAMVELMEYNPNVTIEIDLTENRRSLPGLAMMSAGKLFWMNNGASSYNDYTHFRTKSMRTIPNEFNGIIPLQLFTYANYPHNQHPYFAQRYNVNSSIVAGYGFWGNLEKMNTDQRQPVGKTVDKAKRIMDDLRYTQTQHNGKVGDSPEIYTTVNQEKASGKVVAFSGSALNYKHQVKVNPGSLLGVINNAYHLKENRIEIPFQFPASLISREAFILPNEGTGISVISSSCWLDNMKLENNTLRIVTGGAGTIRVKWPENISKPEVEGENITYDINERDNHYVIQIDVEKSKVSMTIH